MTGSKTSAYFWEEISYGLITLKKLQKDCSNAQLSLPISEIEQILWCAFE